MEGKGEDFSDNGFVSDEKWWVWRQRVELEEVSRLLDEFGGSCW